MAPRGTLIVIEGGDKTGKSTCSRLLREVLCKNGVDTILLHFPDRHTKSGEVINAYLKKDLEIDSRAIHLLFAANRWEKQNLIIQTLERGSTVILDRYSMSGNVYSNVLRGLDWNWCKLSDTGLVKPDLTFLLSRPVQFNCGGLERFEEESAQIQIQQAFERQVCETWVKIDNSQQIDDVVQQMVKESLSCIASHRSRPLTYF